MINFAFGERCVFADVFYSAGAMRSLAHDCLRALLVKAVRWAVRTGPRCRAFRLAEAAHMTEVWRCIRACMRSQSLAVNTRRDRAECAILHSDKCGQHDIPSIDQLYLRESEPQLPPSMKRFMLQEYASCVDDAHAAFEFVAAATARLGHSGLPRSSQRDRGLCKNNPKVRARPDRKRQRHRASAHIIRAAHARI